MLPAERFQTMLVEACAYTSCLDYIYIHTHIDVLHT